MKKKLSLKLISCDVCERPMVLYSMGPELVSANVQPSQGPNTAPWVKSWCGGECNAITIPFALEIDSLLRLSKSAKNQGVKMLAKAVAKRLGRLAAQQMKDVKKLVESLTMQTMKGVK